MFKYIVVVNKEMVLSGDPAVSPCLAVYNTYLAALRMEGVPVYQCADICVYSV